MEALLSEKVWHDTVRGQIDYLLAQQGEEAKKVATRMLLDEQPARAVAAEFSLPVSRVYRIARRARMLLSNNAMLFDLHRESP
jgi:DNA invertase Pin-like site-specific DNA recombinase